MFLAKNTLNSKVNNWATEISPFRITFEYIKGIKNTLADTMSRLIEIDSQVQHEPEPEGYEFGYYVFDNLPSIEVTDIEFTTNSITDIKAKDTSGSSFQGFPIGNDVLQKLQHDDVFCKNILNQIKKGNIPDRQLYLVKNNILERYVLEGSSIYETTVTPRALTGQILRMAHDELGHNGTDRTYTMLKRLYYWKSLKPSIEKHIKMYYQCQRRNKQVIKYATLHFDEATFPMQFISMDLIGEFHPPTSRKHRICFNSDLYANRLCFLCPFEN